MRNDKRLTKLEQQRPTGKVIVIDCRGKPLAEIAAELATVDAGDIVIKIVSCPE